MQVFTPQEFVDYIKEEWQQDPDPTLPGSKLVERIMGSHKNLERFTRTGEGEVFALHTLNEQVKQGGSYVYEGASLKCVGDNRWTFCTYTLDQGRHVLSFEAQLDRDGVLLEEMLVNCFGLGMQTMYDQECVTQHLKSLLKKDLSAYWDTVE